jgi:hypothetical protein
MEDPKAVVKQIQKRFKLAPPGGLGDGNFANVESSTKTKQKDYENYRDYYLKEKCVMCLLGACEIVCLCIQSTRACDD